MSGEEIAVSAGVATLPLEEARIVPAKTFGIIDIEQVTVPELIAAIIDGTPLKWPEGDGDQERAVLQRLAEATGEGDLFGDLESASWGDLLGVPVEVRGFRMLPGTKDDAVMFAVVNIYRLDEGESAVVTTGAKGVLIQLLQGLLLGLVPGTFRLDEVGKEVKGRSRPQRLTRLGDLPADV